MLIANDGVEALDCLLGMGPHADVGPLRPALVMLGMKMPRLNGLDLREHVRRNAATRRLPVVTLTPSDEDSDVLPSYDLGANSYMRKLISFNELAETAGRPDLHWLLPNEPPPEFATA